MFRSNESDMKSFCANKSFSIRICENQHKFYLFLHRQQVEKKFNVLILFSQESAHEKIRQF